MAVLLNCTTHIKLTLQTQTEQNKSLKTATAGWKSGWEDAQLLTDQNGRSRPGTNNHNESYQVDYLVQNTRAL